MVVCMLLAWWAATHTHTHSRVDTPIKCGLRHQPESQIVGAHKRRPLDLRGSSPRNMTHRAAKPESASSHRVDEIARTKCWVQP